MPGDPALAVCRGSCTKGDDHWYSQVGLAVVTEIEESYSKSWNLLVK